MEKSNQSTHHRSHPAIPTPFMRLCFYNPHAVVSGLGETVLSRVAQFVGTSKRNLRKHNLKYGFLLDILRNKKYDSAIMVDGADSSFAPILNKIWFLRNNLVVCRAISFVEIYLWCLVNHINPFRRVIIFCRDKLDERSDILFSFAFGSEFFLNERMVSRSTFRSFKGKKLLHASHYYKHTRQVSENVKKTNTVCMVAEANLKNSPYFNKFFSYVSSVYTLPHALRGKYVKVTHFEERENRCLALGTLVIESESDSSNDDYFDFFGINTLHPMRKAIFENRHTLSELIDCCIHFHNERRLAMTSASNSCRGNNVFKLLHTLFFLSEGKAYHRMDIVRKYNEYKMFVAPEENIGLSSINVVEGMACGCAFIGLHHAMYTDLGMVDGQHYIAYDGTLSDLKQKIRYYQHHQVELKEIAQNGYEFAREKFSTEEVIGNFWRHLNALQSV